MDILQLYLSGTIDENILWDWLKTEKSNFESITLVSGFPHCKDCNSTEFINAFILHIHKETQWLINEKALHSKSVNASKQVGSGTPTTASFNSHESTNSRNENSFTPDTENSRNLCESSQNRRRVRLFASPGSGNASPAQHPESPFVSSTPKRGFLASPNIGQGTPVLTDSPVWSSDIRSPLSKTKGQWNLDSSHQLSSHVNLQRTPSDDPRSKSQTKFLLGDFLVEGNLKKFKNRRIKPTKISTSTNKVAGLHEPDVNFQVPETIDFDRTVLERENLKQECDSLQKRLAICPDSIPSMMSSPLRKSLNNDSNVVSASPRSPGIRRISSNNSSSSSSSTAITLPCPSLVTESQTLDKYSNLMAFILNNSFCDNIMTELHFLVSLMILTDSNCTSIGFPPFDSVHNVVYFAVTTLSKIKEIIMLLNAATLNLLSSASVVSAFAPHFQMNLELQYKIKLANTANVIRFAQERNVSFQCDTDNSENFTSQLNFSCFRKQRDALYQLLQNWEENPGLRNWDNRVRAIIAIRDDPTNLVHLARLFCHQLLASCSAQNCLADDAGRELLELLPTADRGKLSRLEARLTGPGRTRGAVPSPDFPGRELFFHDFVLACDSHVFLHFLQLTLLRQLLDFNDYEFIPEGNDSYTDVLTQNRYLECVSSSRLLAKFLALVQYLPYRGNQECSKQIIQMHSDIRLMERPLFEVEEHLRNAGRDRRLIVTVPWIVSYVSIMDPVSASLPCYRGLWGCLKFLKRSLPPTTLSGRFLLQLCLGWLFQITRVPDADITIIEIGDVELGLDDMDVVSDTALYTVCPYLAELGAVLIGNSHSSVRHIRPTPQPDPQRAQINATKHLELKLEESFLQNQSSSTRRAIQFTAERVASCCIKALVKDILPRLKTEAKDSMLSQINTVDAQVSKCVDETVYSWENNVKTTTSTATWRICEERVKAALTSLLGCDIVEPVVTTACQLSTRQAVEKVESWLHTHVLCDTAREYMKKELIEIISEKCEDVKDGADPKEEDGIAPLSECLELLRSASWDALHGQLNEDTLLRVCTALDASIPDTYFPIHTERSLFCIVADLLILLYLNNTHLLQRRLDLSYLLRRLHPERHTSTPLDRLFCERNMEIICKKRGLHSFTEAMTALWEFLLVESLLTRDSLQQQIASCAIDEDMRKQLIQKMDLHMI